MARWGLVVVAAAVEVAVVCGGLSHAPATQGTAACRAMYDDCLQTHAPETIAYCTEKMSGMWNCPITIGQYQACFNDLNSMFFALVEKQAVCAPLDENICGPQSIPPSCQAADCDYTWAD